jgi:hypothetical protein
VKFRTVQRSELQCSEARRSIGLSARKLLINRVGFLCRWFGKALAFMHGVRRRARKPPGWPAGDLPRTDNQRNENRRMYGNNETKADQTIGWFCKRVGCGCRSQPSHDLPRSLPKRWGNRLVRGFPHAPSELVILSFVAVRN